MNYSLIPLAVNGIVDAISFTIVAPSILFYVFENGGNRNQYGIILSSFSFSSFCTKPFLGRASDQVGFRVPYLVTQSTAIAGSALYVAAGIFPSGPWSVFGGIMVSRFIMGVGAANDTLGFAYIARVIPHTEMTAVTSMLSMVRLVGMMVGPLFNAILDRVDVSLFGGKIVLNSLNSVGLVVFILNLLAMVITSLFLQELPINHEVKEELLKETSLNSDIDMNEKLANPKWQKISVLFNARILIPFFTVFSYNANFQLIETGLSPASYDGLGWGPFRISLLMGYLSIILGVGFGLVAFMSKKKVTNEQLLSVGLVMSTIGYFLIYFLWARDVPTWRYVVPVGLAAGSFAFMAVPSRTIFTEAVNSIPELRYLKGTMQACYSMVADIAGFAVPTLVAKYVLKHPKELNEMGPHGRELRMLALFAPGMSLLVLLGVIFMTKRGLPKVKEVSDDSQNLPLISTIETNQIEKGENIDVKVCKHIRRSTEGSASATNKDKNLQIKGSSILSHLWACHENSASLQKTPVEQNGDVEKARSIVKRYNTMPITGSDGTRKYQHHHMVCHRLSCVSIMGISQPSRE